MWGAIVGLVAGALVLVVFVVLQRGGETPPRTDGATPTPSPTPTTTGSPEPSPVADEEAIPGVGGDVFLAGLARVPVPVGWTLIARGDRPDDPGGYSESAVLVDPTSAITLGVYLLAESTDPADALAVADERAREWTRDATAAEFELAESVPTFGEVAGAASVRYRYVRGTTRLGEVVVAVREDGLTLVVFADGERTAFQGDAWRPVRDEVLEGFGA